ncbi:MAG TPA: LON peptidase substrate-binding domain-containing protein, partial [Polyangia bacterium]
MEFLPDGTIKQTLEIPPTLALLPIRDLVVFPYMVVPLMVSREMSVAAVDEALATKDRLVLLCAQTDESEDEPSADGIHRFGTVGMIMRMRKLSDGRIKVLVQGLMRARIKEFVQKAPCYTVTVERVDEPQLPPGAAEAEALMRAVRDDLTKFSQAGKLQSPELMLVVSGVEDAGRLADLVASNVTMKVSTGQGLLEEMDPIERLRKVGAILQKEVEILEVQATIQSRAKEEMSKAQREYFLREQLRQIQSELGGGGSKGELDSLRAQIETARMPPEARNEADRQLRRLEQANPDSAESGVLRTYLEWLVEMPWVVATDDKLDLAEARSILDE